MSKINDLKAKKAARDALIVQRNRVELKRTQSQAEIAELSAKIEDGKSILEALEMAAILEEATDAELHAARTAHMDLIERLKLANMRLKLIGEAVSDIAAKLEASAQDIKTAKHYFCCEVRDSKLAEIKGDKKFKVALLEAIAAMACNGLLSYTNNCSLFAQQNLSRIIPEILEEEVLEATEKFKKTNFLD